MVIGSLPLLKGLLPHFLRHPLLFVLYLGNTLCEREFGFTDITLPAYSMTAFQCFLYPVHQRVEWHIQERVVEMVVGCFQHEPASEGMVSETGQCLVVILMTEAMGKLECCIFGSQHEHIAR